MFAPTCFGKGTSVDRCGVGSPGGARGRGMERLRWLSDFGLFSESFRIFLDLIGGICDDARCPREVSPLVGALRLRGIASGTLVDCAELPGQGGRLTRVAGPSRAEEIEKNRGGAGSNSQILPVNS